MKEKILIVDGYNMIAFWEETRSAFKKEQLDIARNLLLQRLSDYASFEKLKITVVFDALHVPGTRQTYEDYNLTVVFTEEDETADSYIERLAAQLNEGRWTVSVATSDLNEQWTIFSQGALRVPARELEKRVNIMGKEVGSLSERIELYNPRLSPIKEDQQAKLQELELMKSLGEE